MRLHPIALLLAVCCALRAGVLSAQQAGSACVAGGWTTPADVALPSGRLVYVEAPFPVRFAGGVMLLGSPTFVWRSATVFADTGQFVPGGYISPDTLAGAIVRSGRDARLVGLPPHTTRMLSPRAVARPDGVLDVFWGASADSAAEMAISLTDLWHASYGPGGWSEPDHVLDGTSVYWNSGAPDVAMIRGRPVAAVPIVRRKAGLDSTGIAVVRRADSAWRTTLVLTGGSVPTSVAVDTTGDGTVELAFTGSMGSWGPRSISNGAFTVRSMDGGATWGPVQALMDGGGALVFAMQAASTTDGVLHLLWGVDSTATGGPRWLARAALANGTAVWRQEPRMPLDTVVYVLQTAPLGDRVLLVARTSPAGTLRWSLLTGSPADSLNALRGPVAASIPRVGAVDGGRVLLTWGVRRPNSYPLFPAFPAPVLVTSSFASRCDSAP